METPLKLGISKCLLGENVRYDGGHKLDRYLRDVLGATVQFVQVCPEVECGLPVPREAMHLVGTQEAPRLMTVRSSVDITERMNSWIRKILPVLEKEDLCGFIFKSKSPSSGMRDIKIYNESGQFNSKKGTGIFARAFMERFPLLPVEDEGRLQDAGLRENFIERIFTAKRWKDMARSGSSVRRLMDFHAAHKLLIMSHGPVFARDLGSLVSRASSETLNDSMESYWKALMTGLSKPATVKKNTNVLQHIAGYFKKSLSADEKQELQEIIGQYHSGIIPLIVPVTLLKHYVRLFQEPYLSIQVYLNPHPAELMLRNHV